MEGNPRQSGDTKDEQKACGESNTVTGGNGTTRGGGTGRPEIQETGGTGRPEVHPDVPRSKTRREAAAGKDEQVNHLTVNQLFCCLEDSEESTERDIAALGRIVQLSKVEQSEADDQKAEKAYSEHVTMLEDPTQMKGSRPVLVRRPRCVT